MASRIRLEERAQRFKKARSSILPSSGAGLSRFSLIAAKRAHHCDWYSVGAGSAVLLVIAATHFPDSTIVILVCVAVDRPDTRRVGVAIVIGNHAGI